jgi:hypothetical protein
LAIRCEIVTPKRFNAVAVAVFGWPLTATNKAISGMIIFGVGPVKLFSV